MSAGKGRVVQCQVEDCSNQVAQKAYYQRYRICKHHSCLASLEHDGKQQRWCQQCGRFQELSEFDGDKRTCRAKLSHHNLRRKAARCRNNSLSEEGSISQLVAASSLHSELSSWGAQSPGACHAEHVLPPGGQEQPGALRWAKAPYSPRRRPALPHQGEAPARQLSLRHATRQQQREEEEVEEDWQASRRRGHTQGQPPPLLLQPAPLPIHVARQQQIRQQAGQQEFKVQLHAPPQQRQQQVQRDRQGQAGQPMLRVNMPQQQQQQQMLLEQAEREHPCEAGQRLFLRPHVRQQHHHHKQQPALHRGKQQEPLEKQQQQQQNVSVGPLEPYKQDLPGQQWQQAQAQAHGDPLGEPMWQRLHSQQSMQSEGDSLPAQLALWAKPGLGRQQQQQQQGQALLAGASAARQGVATSAAMLWEGQQDRPGAGPSLSARVSDGGMRGEQLAAGRKQQPHGALPTARILPDQPLSHADLAAMLSAPKRVCRLHAGAAEWESPFHVSGLATVTRVPGQPPSPTAGPAPTAPGPSLAAVQPPATASPVGARAPPQQQQQQPHVVAASGKQASPGVTIDDILELLSWGSPKEDEPVKGSLEGSWLTPLALPLSLRGSPLEQARAPTPPFPDPHLLP